MADESAYGHGWRKRGISCAIGEGRRNLRRILLYGDQHLGRTIGDSIGRLRLEYEPTLYRVAHVAARRYAGSTVPMGCAGTSANRSVRGCTGADAAGVNNVNHMAGRTR